MVRHFGGQSLDVAVSGDPAGIHVHDFITKGLAELFKTPHGGVLVRDAGYIVFRVTFDGDTFVGSEIVVNKGPHPQADSDFELFCQIMPGALGSLRVRTIRQGERLVPFAGRTTTVTL